MEWERAVFVATSSLLAAWAAGAATAATWLWVAATVLGRVRVPRLRPRP